MEDYNIKSVDVLYKMEKASVQFSLETFRHLDFSQENSELHFWPTELEDGFILLKPPSLWQYVKLES